MGKRTLQVLKSPGFRQKALWFGEFAIIAAGVVLTAIYWDESLRADFLGSFLASTLALIVGVPIGILINEEQRKAGQRDLQKAQLETEEIYRRRIISLVVHELNFNRDMLNRRRVGGLQKSAAASAHTTASDDSHKPGEPHAPEAGPPLVLWSPLKVDLWRAVSDSGEIKFIHDTTALDAIVRAYYRIGITMEFERRHMDVVLQSKLIEKDSEAAYSMAIKRLNEILVQGDRYAIRAIDDALEKLNASPAVPQPAV